jgi:hypothetical protein
LRTLTSGKQSASRRPAPLRTGRTSFPVSRLKQAAGAAQVGCAGFLRRWARYPRWQEACTSTPAGLCDLGW